MSTEKTWQTESLGSESTSVIGERFGRACKGGETFLLVSDLGGGKTTFVQGLAKGLGSKDHVGSPTFTINRVYKCRDNLELQHFDFYRLEDAGVVGYELQEVVDDPNTVVAIEWGDIVQDALPENRIMIELARVADDEEKRTLTVTYPSQYAYIVEPLS